MFFRKFFRKFFTRPTSRIVASQLVRFGVYGFAALGAATAGEWAYRQGTAFATKYRSAVVVDVISLPGHGSRSTTLYHTKTTTYSGSPPLAQLEQAGLETAQKIFREDPRAISGVVTVYGGRCRLGSKDDSRSRTVLSTTGAGRYEIRDRVRDIE